MVHGFQKSPPPRGRSIFGKTSGLFGGHFSGGCFMEFAGRGIIFQVQDPPGLGSVDWHRAALRPTRHCRGSSGRRSWAWPTRPGKASSWTAARCAVRCRAGVFALGLIFLRGMARYFRPVSKEGKKPVTMSAVPTKPQIGGSKAASTALPACLAPDLGEALCWRRGCTRWCRCRWSTSM